MIKKIHGFIIYFWKTPVSNNFITIYKNKWYKELIIGTGVGLLQLVLLDT